MDIRPLSDDFAVSPQIDPADLPQIAAEGFTHIICNRPEFESHADQSPQAIQSATEAAGLGFSDNPMVGGQLTMEQIAAQAAPQGKVLAYCASGTRSAILWALSRAGDMPTDDILAALEQAGFPMPGMRPQIAALAKAAGQS